MLRHWSAYGAPRRWVWCALKLPTPDDLLLSAYRLMTGSARVSVGVPTIFRHTRKTSHILEELEWCFDASVPARVVVEGHHRIWRGRQSLLASLTPRRSSLAPR